MIVHYKIGNSDTCPAPCGYKFEKRLKGLDFNTSMDPNIPNPVDCLNARVFHTPKHLSRRRWESLRKKFR